MDYRVIIIRRQTTLKFGIQQRVSDMYFQAVGFKIVAQIVGVIGSAVSGFYQPVASIRSYAAGVLQGSICFQWVAGSLAAKYQRTGYYPDNYAHFKPKEIFDGRHITPYYDQRGYYATLPAI